MPSSSRVRMSEWSVLASSSVLRWSTESATPWRMARSTTKSLVRWDSAYASTGEVSTTARSMSLSERASPRACEPNTTRRCTDCRGNVKVRECGRHGEAAMRKHDRSYLKDLTYHFEGTYADAVLFGAPIKESPPVIAPVEKRSLRSTIAQCPHNPHSKRARALSSSRRRVYQESDWSQDQKRAMRSLIGVNDRLRNHPFFLHTSRNLHEWKRLVSRNRASLTGPTGLKRRFCL